MIIAWISTVPSLGTSLAGPIGLADSLRAMLEPIAIVAGLAFSSWTAWRLACVNQVSTLVAITKSHRELWGRLYERPDLARVTDPRATLKEKPVSLEERLFVLLLILHAYSVFEAGRLRVLRRPPRQDEDLAAVFSSPVARVVWDEVREYQDPRFRAYLDSLLLARAPALRGQDC